MILFFYLDYTLIGGYDVNLRFHKSVVVLHVLYLVNFPYFKLILFRNIDIIVTYLFNYFRYYESITTSSESNVITLICINRNTSQ